MGTTARIVLYARDEAAASVLSARAFERIAHLDAILSDYRDDSELNRLSHLAGAGPQRVSDDLFRVLEAAQRFSAATDGAFDVTVGPLSRLWRRARAEGKPPDDAKVRAAQEFVGYRKVELSAADRTVALRQPGMRLDLGGIGKGYAADEALQVLRKGGAPASLVVIGGDVVAGEAPPDKAGWQIAVAPFGMAGGEDLPTRLLHNAAVSTSGDAEQFLAHDGTRYSHVLDPSRAAALTGRRGVTVIASEGMTADALSTALVVAGVERGVAIVDRIPAASALFVEAVGGSVRTRHSTSWRWQ